MLGIPLMLVLIAFRKVLFITHQPDERFTDLRSWLLPSKVMLALAAIWLAVTAAIGSNIIVVFDRVSLQTHSRLL